MASDNHPFLPSAMKPGKIARFIKALSTGISLLMLAATAHAQFVHPGCLSTQADLDRMKAKVDTGQQPWTAGYDRLVAAPYGQLGHTPSPQPILYASGSQPDNYINLARDVAAAYQVALRYHVSGDEAYAAKAVSILMAWANTHTSWNGNTNVSLRAGLYGYQLACAGELVRNYSGWAPADFAKFQSYVRTQFYKIVSPNDVDRGFLFHHHGTCWSHYWANWDLAAMATVIATGVLCDDQAIFQEGIDYFYNGIGVGRISELLHYLHPNGLGQSQEFGRDQGHATMLVPLLGTFCEIAWNQGVDLYSELDNGFLAMSENLAKYGLWYDVPYVPYINCEYIVQTNIGTPARGHIRAGVDLVYNHYVNRMGMSAPYTQQAAAAIRPEGGGGQNGADSGGYDQLGFTTLTHTLDPIAAGVAPSQLRAHVKGGKVTLSWRGSAYATSYNVKRATTSGGPYTTLARTDAKTTSFIDAGRVPGTTYYYVVSANNPGGESANSAQISATHDGQLYGTLIGTTGSAGNWGATRELAMDGSLKNYMDAWAPDGGWVGLDLGAGVSAVITAVKYCPRSAADTTVGGKFQGSNTADFSSGVVDLLTVTTAPPGGVLTTQAINNGNAFRYVRFKAPTNSYCTLAEVQFIGNVTGMSAPASAPTGLAVSSPASGQATITWNSVSGATDYVIKRATNSGGPYTVVDYTTWSTSYTERGLAAGTYYYVVSALNSIGETVNSQAQSIQLLAGVSQGAATSAYAGSGNFPEGSDRAVDGNNATKWFSGSGSSSGWLQIDLGAGNAQTVVRYDLTSANDAPARDPKDWQVLGSNDGTSWTTLDSRTGETFASRFLTKSYTFTNTTAYRYYRLNILSSFSGIDGIQLAEWTLLSAQNGGASTISPVEVSWLKLDETGGTTAADASGNNKPGTLINSPVRSGGKIGNALGLNGSNQYASLPAGVASNLNDFTLSAWVYWNGGNNWQRIFDFGSGTSTYMFLTPKNGVTGTVRFAITTSGASGEQKIDGNAALASSGWHHVAVTLSGTIGTLYVDGQQVGQNTGLTLKPSSLGTTTQNWIGRSQYNDPYFNGRVDDFRIYARALSFPAIAALAAPMEGTGLAATGEVQQITLGWNATPGASSYTVRRATTSGGAYTQIASGLTGTSYIDSGLSEGTTYYYIVTPTNNLTGDGANSLEVAVATIPAAPGNLVVTGGNGQASLSWTGSTGATGYSVLRATSPNGSYTTVASGLTGTSYLDSGLTSGTTYYYAVVATNGSGSSANSAQVNAITAPSAPGGLVATADNAQVSLQWNASTGAATYNVLRSTTSGSGYATVATGIAGTSYVDPGLTNDTTYYYVVTATNSGGTSANSSQASATPVALPSPWATLDIGNTGATGSASRSPSGVFTVIGAGTDIWDNADSFRYVYQTASGDCDITARVTAIGNTNAWAKSGVMIRETLATGSRHAMAIVTPGSGVSFQRRTATNGTSAHTTIAGITAPQWVRVTRVGDVFTAYYSANGTSWTNMGSVTIAMSGSVYIGLPVTSHANGTLCTATFESVTVTP
jgi:fibronectin type 3 domain-containing protein/regulation of enolase protein 1 (concanavalin A-like superfamily)